MKTDFVPIFTMTDSELADILMAFSGHATRVEKQNLQLHPAYKFVLLEGVIDEFIASLASWLAEGLSVSDAAQSCYPYPMIKSGLPPEIVTAWWRGRNHGREHLGVQQSESSEGVPVQANTDNHER
ncbi:MAG: hypothetical protein MSG64_19220 [Pyrinomonadaceae bacterium MAG19_C2-C3]|nr:hypothetical protein [Pyrinomonadaceae bacterium MAG19_C2-C3]